MKARIFLIIFCCYGCSNPEEKRLDSLDMDYLNDKSKFDSTMVEHFPRELKNSESRYLFTEETEYGHPRFWLQIKLEAPDLKKIVDFVEEEALGTYLGNDECILAIDGHLTSDNWM